MNARHLRLWALAMGAMVMGCGTAVESTHRGALHAAVQPYLVGVTESAPTRPFRVISVSIDKHDARRAAPDSISDGALDAMKAYAGSRGAKMLWVERSMNRWQRRFYGWGLIWVDSPDSATKTRPCDHAGFQAAVAAAKAAARTCFTTLRDKRPTLAGEVEIIFEVDAWGGIRHAVPAPSSSRDTQVHSCAMLAVYRRNYGPPPELWCRARLKTSVR